MARHDDRPRMRQMFLYARKAQAITHGRSRAGLDLDEVLQLALTRATGAIGEAAKRVSEAARRRYGASPWRDIAGIRNRLIHGYDVLGFGVLGHTLTDAPPSLIDRLQDAPGIEGIGLIMRGSVARRVGLPRKLQHRALRG